MPYLLQQGPLGAPGSVGHSGNKGPIVSYLSLFSWHLSLQYLYIIIIIIIIVNDNDNNDNDNDTDTDNDNLAYGG